MLRVSATPQRRGEAVNRAWLVAKLFLGLALVAGLGYALPLQAQTPLVAPKTSSPDVSLGALPFAAELDRPAGDLRFRTNWMPGLAPGYIAFVAADDTFRFRRISWTSSPSTIERMESAFYCNDTPFVDQVRLPLATFWNGRVKLIGFESDVTTANFVLGLPGQGSLHTLSAFGNAFIATHTPPSDQLAGIHVSISLRPTGTDAGENSGRRGIEYLVRASRSVLPFLSVRSDSISFPAR